MREVILFGGKYKCYDELLKFIMEKDEIYKETFVFITSLLPLEEIKLLSRGKINHLEGLNYDIYFNVNDNQLNLDYKIKNISNKLDVSIKINMPSFLDSNGVELASLNVKNITSNELFKIKVLIENRDCKSALVIYTNKLENGKSNSVSFKKIFFSNKELPIPGKKR